MAKNTKFKVGDVVALLVGDDFCECATEFVITEVTEEYYFLKLVNTDPFDDLRQELCQETYIAIGSAESIGNNKDENKADKIISLLLPISIEKLDKYGMLYEDFKKLKAKNDEIYQEHRREVQKQYDALTLDEKIEYQLSYPCSIVPQDVKFLTSRINDRSTIKYSVREVKKVLRRNKNKYKKVRPYSNPFVVEWNIRNLDDINKLREKYMEMHLTIC